MTKEDDWKETGKWGSEGEFWDQDTGAPSVSHFGNALQVWSVCQGKPTSVADAAKAFNVPTARIYEAAKDHGWMFVTNGDDPTRDIIEHEGE